MPVVAASAHGKIDSGASLTISVTVPDPLLNGLLVVMVAINAAGVTVSSVTHNGDALTRQAGTTLGVVDGEVFTILAPDTGTHGVIVTASAAAAIQATVAAVKFVDPSTPIHAASATNGTSTAPALQPSSDAQGLVISGVAAQEVGGGTQSATVDGGSTEIANEKTGGGGVGDILGAAASKPGTGGFVGPSWTLNDSADWVVAAVSLNPYVLTGSATVRAYPRSRGGSPSLLSLLGIDYGSSDLARALDYRLRKGGL